MSTARRVGGILAGLLVVAFLVWGVAGGWSEAASYDWDVDGSRLAISIAVLVLFFLAWGVGYVALVEGLERQRVERGRVTSVWARSLLGRYVPGNVVMFAARAVLGREAGVPARVSLTASVYEQVAMLAAAAIGAGAFLFVWQGAESSPLFWLVVLTPLAILLLDPAVIGRATDAVLARLGRSERLLPLPRASVPVVFGWFGVTMVLLALGSGLGVRAVAGSDVDDVAYVGLGFLFAWVVSMLAFIFPSGLGVREGALAVVLARDIPTSAAVSLAAASRLLLTAVELVVIAAVVAAAAAAEHGSARPVERR